MKRYEVTNLKTGQTTNAWTSDFAGPEYYEPCFGKPERWVRADQEDVTNAVETKEERTLTGETVTLYRLPAEFTIVETDITSELEEQKWSAFRQERNRRLSECDWTQMPDAPLSQEEKQAWASYRKALRDLPEMTADPQNPVWPEQP